MLRATCVCATLMKKPDVRKDYSATVRAIVVEEPPAPWTEVGVDAQYTVTLLAFSWALLPVGFMVMVAIFDRYQTHRLPLAAGALVMLALAFTSGVGQRRSAWFEGRIQLATASLLSTGLSWCWFGGSPLRRGGGCPTVWSLEAWPPCLWL